MKRLLALAAVVTVTACADQVTTGPSEAPVSDAPLRQLQVRGPEGVNPGRVLVKLRNLDDEDEVAAAHGLQRAGRGHNDAFVIMRGAAGNERAVAARLGDDARVEWAEPDYLRQPIAIDPALWAFHNPGGLTVRYTTGRQRNRPVNSYKSVADADVDNFENSATGGGQVYVGSIDTGVEMSHAEFTGIDVIPGWDWYDNDNDPSDSDDHGTHTTGTMVGNTVGIAGVAGANVGVYVQRVCGALGCPTSAIANAIEAAADERDNGLDIVAINLSLGGGSLSSAEAAAIDHATVSGLLVIASAGNGGVGQISCPACDPDAMAISATNWQDELAYYSSYGSGLSGSTISLAAPGGELYSNTTDEAGIWSAVRGGYDYNHGTSMAAPHVTGIAGIVASVSGDRGAALRSKLESTADDLGNAGPDNVFGHGRVNAMKALGGGTGNPPGPTASFTKSCIGLLCTFDATGSSGNGISDYDWTFGDGGAQSGASAEIVSHTYAATKANYTVTLTITDSEGNDSTSETVNCRRRRGVFSCN